MRLFGAYLEELGLSDPAIIFLTNTQPSAVQWLSPAAAREYGMDVTMVPSGTPFAAITDTIGGTAP